MNIKNLALSTVETAPSPATTGTTIVLETGTGNRFPDTANGDFFITAMPSDEQPHIDNSEILKVTDRTDDILTVVREQRETTAKAIEAGWTILASLYKEDWFGLNSVAGNETPTGTIDGVNKVFNLVSAPATNTLALYRDGQLLKGGGEDYDLDDDEITFVEAPEIDSVLLAFYLFTVSSSGNADTLDGKHAPTGDIVGTTDNQELTNKILTSPLFQGLIDGWVSANETWTYASATTITVPSGATNKYQKGDKIKLTQGTNTKYFYIVGVTSTVLTITGGSDYTLTNSAISNNYYSKVENPQGFPLFGFAGAITNLTLGSAITTAYFALNRLQLSYSVLVNCANNTVIAGEMFLALPITPSGNYASIAHIGDVIYFDSNVGRFTGAVAPNGALRLYKVDTLYATSHPTSANTPMTVVSGDYISITGSYTIG